MALGSGAFVKWLSHKGKAFRMGLLPLWKRPRERESSTLTIPIKGTELRVIN